MGNNWCDSNLGAVANISMGQSPKGIDCNTSGEGVPLLNGPTEFGSNHPQPKQFTTDPKKLAKKGDILFCVRGSTTGKMNWADQTYAIGRGLAAINHKEGNDYQSYLKAVIDFQLPKILVSATGSTFPNVSKDQLNSLILKVPPLTEQKAIAQILGSLDNKIELNRLMNQTLEKMAQALYKSWFVDFDPVFDNAIAAGIQLHNELKAKAEQRKALGSKRKPLPDHIQKLFPNEFEFCDDLDKWIPKGWETTNLEELVTVKYGKDHKKLEDGIIPVYGSGGIMRFVNQSLYKGESVLIPRKGTLNNIMYVNEEFWSVDTMFFTIMKQDNVAKYIYYTLIRLDFENMNVGSAVPSMTTQVLNSLVILKPSTDVLSQFDSIVRLYFSRKNANNQNTNSLIKTRDTLLPKLISGEISVPI